MPYVLTKRAYVHGGPRMQYSGILKCPKSEWPSKAKAKRSRAYKMLKAKGYEPRVKTLRRK